jgi:serine protein kinase
VAEGTNEGAGEVVATEPNADGQAPGLRADELIGGVAQQLLEEFRASRRLLSFEEYIRLVLETPHRHVRSAAQYIRDCFDHFGSYEVDAPGGRTRRFRLFDGLPGSSYYLIGQEAAQNAVYQLLDNFTRAGAINRLVLLHGPNGSAKSSLVGCISRALEAYSKTEEGALYRFNWIFPSEAISRSGIGFGPNLGPPRRDAEGNVVSPRKLPSYAHLEDLEIAARLQDEMRDSPLLLLPASRRRELIERAFAAKGGARQTVPELLRVGDLSAKNKRIAETLLAANRGDLTEVLKHVQVERFYLSRRYRVGLATIGPEMRVDASVRQITADRTLSALPGSLQSLTLYEPYGGLVDGNRGMVEFNDMLKRPMDLNRYLLGTSETSTVPLDTETLHLDSFLIGTVNESYLDALKAQPDWSSYKGRFELIRMGYLLDYRAERRIYEVQIEQLEIDKPIAPHVAELTALWAVLTRLQAPDAEEFPKPLRTIVANLSPLDKARLYAEKKLPEGVGGDAARELLAAVEALVAQGAAGAAYEGRIGASPRELKGLLLNAAHGDGHQCFSPPALFRELTHLVEDPSVYEFLRVESAGAYYRPAKFVEVVEDVYLDRLDDEVRTAMGLVEEAQYAQLFQRYVDHVNHWLRKEKLLNPLSGKYEAADERFMADVEEKLGVEGDRTEYRNSIISSIGAFRIENPKAPVDLGLIFTRQFEILRGRFFDERRDAIQRVKLNLLRYFDNDMDDLSAGDRQLVERTLQSLRERYGYNDEAAREAIGYLVRRRYDD